MKKLLGILLVCGVLNVGGMGLAPMDTALGGSRPWPVIKGENELFNVAKEGKLARVQQLLNDKDYLKQQLQNVLDKLSGITAPNSEEIKELLKAKIYRIEHPFVKLQ